MAGLELWLIRHGETDWNRDGRVLASTDVALNEAGLEQARRLGARLAAAGVRFDGVYCSDMDRARTTAELVFPRVGIQPDPRLRELDYGVFEGERWDALDAERAELARVWRADPYSRRTPGGESYDDVITRFDSFRAELPPSSRIAVVTHGGTIRCVLYAAMGRPPRGHWSVEIANTAITRVRYDDGVTTLISMNDHSHLGLGLSEHRAR